jgi:hypothetical protein
MNIIHSDLVVRVAPGTTPDYNRGNSLVQLLTLMEKTELSAEREHYRPHSLQYLLPFKSLELYGPAGSDADNLQPEKQDNKTDFQKQNVKSFLTTDIQLTRGLVSVGDWTGPFLRASYRGGPDSKLSGMTNHRLGERIKLWLKVNDVVSTQTIAVPYNDLTDRYEVELWGYPRGDLMRWLDAKGRAAFERGEILARPDIIQGSMADFERGGLNDKNMFEVAPNNAMHRTAKTITSNSTCGCGGGTTSSASALARTRTAASDFWSTAICSRTTADTRAAMNSVACCARGISMPTAGKTSTCGVKTFWP